LEPDGDDVFCRLGRMELSSYLHRQLEAWIADDGLAVDPAPAPDPSEEHVLYGGVWLCPADGSLMRESEQRPGAICSECGRCLPSRFMYMLIKLHSHERLQPKA
jgi:hypothetical protein